MADNYLITGYWGEPHVTAENDRGINAAMFGIGRFVLPVGEQFKAEYIGNNTIRMYDGKLIDNGAAAGIPAGEYVDLLIANAGQGMKRNDLIVFQYSQDTSTLIESGKFVVIQGTETSGTPYDPTLTQGDLLSGKASFDQMALWRVSVSGTTIAAPVNVFSVARHPRVVIVKTAGTSLDDYTEEGVYYFSGDYTPLGVPSGVNGWLDVKPAGSATKQFWFRHGTPGTTDFNTLFRTYSPSTGWGEWVDIITGKTVQTTIGGEIEWIKPPMMLETEYRTTERYANKIVYAKAIPFPTLAGGGAATSSPHNLGHTITNVVDIKILLKKSGSPFKVIRDGDNGITVNIESSGMVHFTSTGDGLVSGYTPELVIKYTIN